MKPSKDSGKLSKIKEIPCPGCQKGVIRLKKHSISWLGSCQICNKFVAMHR